MKIGLSSMMRERWIAVSRCAGSGNCARTGMIHGARTQRSAENAISAMTMAFRTLDATRQASSSRSLARYPVKTGMNALASAPATSRLNSVSGIRNAAQNASSSGVCPNVAPMTDRRSHPRRRLPMSVAIMRSDARPTLICMCVEV